jgi:predicted RNA-binding Zn-ribbon protein involved in translation (DUF1610 family)
MNTLEILIYLALGAALGSAFRAAWYSISYIRKPKIEEVKDCTKKFKPTGFVAVFECVNCDRQLSDTERFYNNGVCPKCGAAEDSTVVKCRRVVIEKYT